MRTLVSTNATVGTTGNLDPFVLICSTVVSGHPHRKFTAPVVAGRLRGPGLFQWTLANKPRKESGRLTNGSDVRWRICVWDVALAVGAAVYQVRDLLLRSSGGWRFGETRWIDVAVWAVLSMLLLLRRRWPVGIAALAVAADLVSFYPAAEAVAMFTVGAHTRSRRLQGALLAAAAVLHALTYWLGHEASMSQLVPHYAVFCVTPMLLGLYVAARYRLSDIQRERMEHMERERLLLDERARMQERRSIAREMHDVVAHGVSHMVFRAGALQMAAESRQAQWAAEEAVTLQSLGRGVLGELRTALGLLGGTGPGERVPLPTAADLPVLLRHARESGLEVNLREDGDITALEPQYGRTVYRVIQEALTNVTKHAPGAATAVDVGFGSGSLTVRIVNDPPGTASGARPADGQVLPPGGHGLGGMRERVELLGGTLEFGPTALGGFCVAAIIPLPPGNEPLRRTTDTEAET